MLNVPEQGFNEKSGCVGLLDVIAGLLLYLFRAIFSKVIFGFGFCLEITLLLNT